MIAVVDYGVGNLFSLCSSLKTVGAEIEVAANKNTIENADKIILPGVGAFGDAMKKLNESGLALTVKQQAKSGKPLLGICLGMQLLFEKSFEFGEHDGLGLVDGEIVCMNGRIPKQLNIPHIGWNGLIIKKESPILKYVNDGDCVYFVHSYYLDGGNKAVTATADYGVEVCASVQKENVFGCQFHPEKSGKVGLNILRAFCEL